MKDTSVYTQCLYIPIYYNKFNDYNRQTVDQVLVGAARKMKNVGLGRDVQSG